MKRLVTIQDISCLGKCSLTVALPIISTCQVECCVIPTAVLSNHTAFDEFTFCDLTDEISKIDESWKRQNFAFDAIYTGYLGSVKQLDLVSNFFDDFKTDNNFIFVDPAMADFGKMYAGFDANFAKLMGQKVCSKADIIVPNLTEAAFMLGKDFISSDYPQNYIEDLLKGLCDFGAKTSVITGLRPNLQECGYMGYDSKKDEFFSYYKPYVDCQFHGTGDVFASVCVGSHMQTGDLVKSLKIAADFNVDAIKATMNNPNHNWYGIDFELCLPALMKQLNL